MIDDGCPLSELLAAGGASSVSVTPDVNTRVGSPPHREGYSSTQLVCDRLRETRRFAEAIEAGLSAVLGEPLRESAHRSLIRAYLAEGNSGEAIRQLQLCRRLLADELGIEPSSETRALVQNL